MTPRRGKAAWQVSRVQVCRAPRRPPARRIRLRLDGPLKLTHDGHILGGLHGPALLAVLHRRAQALMPCFVRYERGTTVASPAEATSCCQISPDNASSGLGATRRDSTPGWCGVAWWGAPRSSGTPSSERGRSSSCGGGATRQGDDLRVWQLELEDVDGEPT